MEPLQLQRHCANCQHFDGDIYCSLPAKDALIRGSIVDCDRVVCEKHEEREDDIKDRVRQAIDAEHAAEERALYSKYSRY